MQSTTRSLSSPMQCIIYHCTCNCLIGSSALIYPFLGNTSILSSIQHFFNAEVQAKLSSTCRQISIEGEHHHPSIYLSIHPLSLQSIHPYQNQCTTLHYNYFVYLIYIPSTYLPTFISMLVFPADLMEIIIICSSNSITVGLSLSLRERDLYKAFLLFATFAQQKVFFS